MNRVYFRSLVESSEHTSEHTSNNSTNEYNNTTTSYSYTSCFNSTSCGVVLTSACKCAILYPTDSNRYVRGIHILIYICHKLKNIA